MTSFFEQVYRYFPISSEVAASQKLFTFVQWVPAEFNWSTRCNEYILSINLPLYCEVKIDFNFFVSGWPNKIQ